MNTHIGCSWEDIEKKADPLQDFNRTARDIKEDSDKEDRITRDRRDKEWIDEQSH